MHLHNLLDPIVDAFYFFIYTGILIIFNGWSLFIICLIITFPHKMATTKSEYLISNSPVSSLTADFKSHKAQFVEKHGVEFSISSLGTIN